MHMESGHAPPPNLPLLKVLPYFVGIRKSSTILENPYLPLMYMKSDRCKHFCLILLRLETMEETMDKSVGTLI